MEDTQGKDYHLAIKLEEAELRLVLGDLTEYGSDALVNAANSELAPGGGVCGAIHRKGGAAIADECREIVRSTGRIPPGQAVATAAGRLRAHYVIHAVGPIWRGGHAGEAEALASCYRSSLRVADELKLRSIAFPAISTGIYGYPLDQAAEVAIAALIESLSRARHVRQASVVLLDASALEAFTRAALRWQEKAAGSFSRASLELREQIRAR
jgi:O-acetyl-ADP-ribose deacetylase (regulator of RNase III)